MYFLFIFPLWVENFDDFGASANKEVNINQYKIIIYVRQLIFHYKFIIFLKLSTTKFMMQSIDYHSEFSPDSWSMNALTTGTDDLIFNNVASIISPAGISSSAGTYSNISFNYNLI